MIPDKYKALSDKEAIASIKKVREKLGDKVIILGHHYQRDEVIRFADIKGDSLKLSQEAAKAKSKFIVFCGVKFMAETADVLSRDDQTVILPDLNAGCPMADMAGIKEVEFIWTQLLRSGIKASEIIPITYVNSSADVKAFCGAHGGLTCTSSNAAKALKWAFKQKKRVLFMPDEHLAENMARLLGLTGEEIYKIDRENFKIDSVGADSADSAGTADITDRADSAKIFIWNGFCPVHLRFTNGNIDYLRKNHPGIIILVHPEVPYEVAKNADFVGSTEFIIKKIKEAKEGSTWAIGTEVHLVNRLTNEHKNKKIMPLSSTMCICSMMDRTSPQHLLWVLEEIEKGNVINQIKVEKSVQKDAIKALNRMLKL